MKTKVFYKIAGIVLSIVLALNCIAVIYTFAVDRQEKRMKAEAEEPTAAPEAADEEDPQLQERLLESRFHTTPIADPDDALCLDGSKLLEHNAAASVQKLTEADAMDSLHAAVGTIGDTVVLKNSALFKELDKGAHYYVFSGYSNTYSEAYTNIVLPSDFYNKDGARNGYISLGIKGKEHGVDAGLGNTGSGWFPYAYDAGHTFTTFTEYTAPGDATNAMVSVKPVDTSTIHMYVQFLDASGNPVGRTFDRDIPIASGNFVKYNNKIMCSFYRFASLVPVAEDDQYDGTYMTGAKFTECQLYNGSNYESWGIYTDRVQNAWIISSGKITVDCTTYNDTFDIRHS